MDDAANRAFLLMRRRTNRSGYRRAIVLCVALAAPLAWVVPLGAQSEASLEGTVTDPQQRPVPGAEVRVTRDDTGLERRGVYGHCRTVRGGCVGGGQLLDRDRVRWIPSGFRWRDPTSQRSGRCVRHGVGARSDAGHDRSAGSTADGIDQSGRLGRSRAAKQLARPAAQRPGSVRVVGTGARRDTARVRPDRTGTGIGRQISVLGARPNQNSFQIDGVYVNDAASASPASAAGNLLGLEMVREVHLVTNPYSAEYGRTVGGVFTAVSRSGGSEFHGSLYEYFRNNALDARNFFDSPSAGTPPLRRNHFGALLGGPAGRRDLFFLVNYEALRERRARTARPAVPTVAARQGRLPGQELSVAPEVRPYLDLYPLPNGRDFGDGTAASVRQIGDRTDEIYASAKFDLLLDSATQASARYTFDDAANRAPDPMDLWVFGLDSNDHFLHMQLKRVHSPSTLSTGRLAFSRVDNFENSTTSVPTDLSFVAGQPMGTITVNGLGNMGGFQARARPRRFILESYQIGGSVVRTSGRGTWRFGGGYDRMRFNQRSDLSAVGAYTFDSLALLLQGRPRIAEVMQPGSDTVRGWRYNQYSAFVQREFRIREGMGASFGLRYESVSTPTEVNGKIAVLRDFVRDSQTTLGGPLWKNPSRDNFAPRVSVAWDPVGDARTVVRAGRGNLLRPAREPRVDHRRRAHSAAVQPHPRFRSAPVSRHLASRRWKKPLQVDGWP